MPTKRTSIIRTRHPGFSREALDLFIEIEKLPPRKRFQDPRSKRLAELLNLGMEYWTVKHVNDPSPRPAYYSPYQLQNWETCRAMRLLLLEATGLSKKSPTQ
jgi:hypothetical protein